MGDDRDVSAILHFPAASRIGWPAPRMSAEQSAQRIPLRRASGRLAAARAFAGRAWKKRWVKVATIILSIPVLAHIILWLLFARGLPSAESLLSYEPVLPTYVRDVDGAPVQAFARERRVQLA